MSQVVPKYTTAWAAAATAVDTAVLGDVMTDKPIPDLFAAGEFVGGIHGADAYRRVRGDRTVVSWA